MISHFITKNGGLQFGVGRGNDTIMRMFGTKRVYLDQASGASGNPSSPHAEGHSAKQKLEAARTRVARVLEVKPDDVVFTSGATQANALAVLGTVRANGVKNPHVLYLPSSHASVIENVKLLEKEGAVIEPLPISDGRVDVGAMEKLLRKETVLVAMDAVCGETGVVWNTREVRRALDAARALGEPRILLHVDAAQAPLTQKCTRAHFGADTLSLDLSKLAPTRGVGCFVAHRTIPLAPLYEGGGQERGLVPGSEAPELSEALADALEETVRNRERFLKQAEEVRSTVKEDLSGKLPRVLVNEGKVQAPNILNISLLGRDTDYLVMLLDKEGFAVSTKSACESDSKQGSRAVEALYGDAARAKSTLRVSWGREISMRDIRRFSSALIRAVAFIDSASGG